MPSPGRPGLGLLKASGGTLMPSPFYGTSVKEEPRAFQPDADVIMILRLNGLPTVLPLVIDDPTGAA